MATDYPSHWESDVVLADGGTLHVRPIKPDDADRLVAFHGRQSSESIYFRFFTPRPKLSSREVERLTVVDYRDRMAFIGLLDDRMLGMALYDRWAGRDEAEVAVMVDDAEHGRGIGTVLLEFLAAAARDAGFVRFTAQVLPSNRKMLGVFKQAGFDASSQFADGVIEVTLGIEPTTEGQAAIDSRAHRAEARSVARLLAPRAVAVIGAGRLPGGLGHQIVTNLVDAGYTGRVHPVNPAATEVAGLAAHPSVLGIADDVDQAVIAVPAPLVPAVVTECARARVQSLVIVSAGFAERSEQGAEVERDVISLARRYGMRVVGPNSLGVLNTDREVCLHASTTPARPAPGPLAIGCQSGALGTAILDHAATIGLGVSTFVEAGNKADVSTNDLLQYWEDDDRTEAILLHVESFGNPRRFSRIARRVARRKPIVAVKGGDVVAGGDVTLDALLRQVGVIRVDSIEAQFDVARVLVHQPLAAGRRVAIVTNATGPALLAADACQAAGLTLSGPFVDLSFDAGPPDYEKALGRLANDDGVDAVLAIYAPPVIDRTDEVAAAIAGAQGEKPVVATVLGAGAGDLVGHDGDTRRVPSFTFPERAARALASAATYGEWRERPEGSEPELSVDDQAPQEVVGDVLARYPDGAWLDLDDTDAVLGAYGLAPVGRQLVGSVDDAVDAARAVGYPVTLKATGLARLGKTEAGGVALDLHGAAEVRRAYQRMAAALGEVMRPALVQAMVTPGVDLSVDLRQDASVGAVLRLGVGGAVASVLRPAAVAVVPLTDLDARRLVEAPAVAELLAAGGVAGEPVVETLLRLSRMADDLPEVAEVWANPLIASPTGVAITDIAIRVAPLRRFDRADLRRL